MATKEFFLGNIKGPGGGSGNVDYKTIEIKKEDWKIIIQSDFGAYVNQFSLLLQLEKYRLPLSKSYYIFGKEKNKNNQIINFDYEVNSNTGSIILFTKEPADYIVYIMTNKENGLAPISINHDINSIYGITGLNRNKYFERTKDASELKTLNIFWLEENYFNSDFRVKAYPWNQISEIKQGDNYFVKIPKFYHKYIKNPDQSYQLLISGKKHDDTWTTAFIVGDKEIPYVLIGKNLGSIENGKMRSYGTQGGLYPSEGVPEKNTIITWRAAAEANGIGYHLFDVWDYEILKVLFLVEYATSNTREVIPFDNIYRYDFSIEDPIATMYFTQRNFNPQLYTSYYTYYYGIAHPFADMFLDGITIPGLNSVTIEKDISKYSLNESDTSIKITNHPLVPATAIHERMLTGIEPLDKIPCITLPKFFNEEGIINLSPDSLKSVELFENAQINVKNISFNDPAICSIGNQVIDETYYRNFSIEGGTMWDLNVITNIEKKYARLCYKPVSEV